MKIQRITWESLSFAENRKFNHWWIEAGFVNNERRFLMFCDKNIKVWLADLKTKETHLLPLGAKAEGNRLSIKILDQQD